LTRRCLRSDGVLDGASRHFAPPVCTRSRASTNHSNHYRLVSLPVGTNMAHWSPSTFGHSLLTTSPTSAPSRETFSSHKIWRRGRLTSARSESVRVNDRRHRFSLQSQQHQCDHISYNSVDLQARCHLYVSFLAVFCPMSLIPIA